MYGKKRLLQSFLNRDTIQRDIYHDLMPFKVREILLISNLYDAFIIEKEGRFSEIMLYDYGRFNLTTLPRITGVTSKQEAFEQLEEKQINMVIIMVGFNKKTPLRISKKIKEKYPQIPVLILLNNNADIKYFIERQIEKSFDKLFIWNGESRIFFAMIKWLEDKRNIQNDTELAAVRAILIVEDSPVFYSAYITHLYKSIFRQTNNIVNEVSSDDLYKVLKLRIRPKILLASNYEDAIELFEENKDFLFCLVTDVEYNKGGELDKNAGIKLIKKIKESKDDLPTIILSSENSYKEVAEDMGLTFIDKNSQNLYDELIFDVTQKIGFGDFIFKNKKGKTLAKAKTIKDFVKKIKKVSDSSIFYHAENNHFSKWLMARAEIQLAIILIEKHASEFGDADEIRNYILKSLMEYRDEKPLGKVLGFDKFDCNSEDNIIRLNGGAFGGKGRGLSFLNALKHYSEFVKEVKGIKVKIPKTAVIGVEEFEVFMKKIKPVLFHEKKLNYDDIKKLFLKINLSKKIKNRLRKLLDCYKKPIAVRSSGLFEDSISQPFAGIFETYVIPNNHPDKNIRFKQLCEAIKLVYASVFSETSRNYTKSLDQKLGEEKMAIVIQELVGSEFEGLYYPHISGVAQSYNFYPFSNMKPNDGFAVLAVGLGVYVVEGEYAYRFSPKYPGIQFLSLEDQVKYTQTYFYGVDMNNVDLNLLDGSSSSLKKVGIYDIKHSDFLKFCVSEYDFNNDAIYPGLIGRGPIVVNFASILKNQFIPLTKTIENILSSLIHAFDTPVEIEFAVDMNRDEDGDASFYILQVKPMLLPSEDYSFSEEELIHKDVILYAEKGMGNGVIDDIFDVIFIDPDSFDTVKTEEMAKEIDGLNQQMIQENRKYLLVGPGRWGTRDRFLGIPVNWTQISNARAIVETDLDGFHLDASYGSHFFHNLTTMNIAYLSVHGNYGKSFINYDILNSAKTIQKTEFFNHVRFSSPMLIKVDGKKRKAVVLKN